MTGLRPSGPWPSHTKRQNENAPPAIAGRRKSDPGADSFQRRASVRLPNFFRFVFIFVVVLRRVLVTLRVVVDLPVDVYADVHDFLRGCDFAAFVIAALVISGFVIEGTSGTALSWLDAYMDAPGRFTATWRTLNWKTSCCAGVWFFFITGRVEAHRLPIRRL